MQTQKTAFHVRILLLLPVTLQSLGAQMKIKK